MTKGTKQRHSLERWLARLAAAALLSASVATHVARAQCVQDEEVQSDQTLMNDELFGEKVAIQDATAVVGARMENGGRGAAYVYERDMSGNWNQVARFTQPSPQAGDMFGSAVAIEGDTIVVGAYGVSNQSGALFVFVRTGSSWDTSEFRATLTANAAYARLGFSVDISDNGQTIIGGAPGWSDPANAQVGCAYTYIKPLAWRSATNSGQLVMTPTEASARAYLGFSVSIASDDRALVGAPGHWLGSDSTVGSACMFVRGQGWFGVKNSLPILRAPSPAVGEGFGRDVAIAVPWIAIGTGNAGEAYVYHAQTVIIDDEEVAVLTSSDPDGDDRFGFSVDIRDGRAVVGSHYQQDIQGAVFVHECLEPSDSDDPPTCAEVASLTATNGVDGDALGWDVALSDTRIIAGAPFTDGQEGSAYLFTCP
ncbi:MAG: FG-GAP repeat protein [Acidobacteriota bacterium]